MSRLLERYRRLQNYFANPHRGALFSALLALALLVPIWWHAGRWYQARLVADQRDRVASELSVHGSTLSSALNRYITLLDGVVAFVNAEIYLQGLFPADEFNTLAAGLRSGTNAISGIAVAPDGIFRYVYPLDGNQTLVGQDWSTHDDVAVQRAIAQAKVSGETVMCGASGVAPEQEFAICQAVFDRGEVWGLAAVVLDLPTIVGEAGLTEPMLAGDLSAALRDSTGAVLYGEPTVFDRDPAVHRIEVPNGYWELAAAPADGWHSPVQEAYRIFQGAGLVIMGLVAGVVYLVDNRQSQLALAVKQRTEQISQINLELEDRVQERTRALSALYDVAAVANSSLDLMTVLRQTLDKVVDVMGVAAGGVCLAVGADTVTHTAADKWLAPETASHLETLVRRPELESWVRERGEPVLVSNVLAVLGEREEGVEGHAYVGAPIRARGKVLGVLGVVRWDGRQFEAQDVELLATFADQLAVATENARLFKEAQGKATLEERHRLARELHDSVTQSLYSLALFTEAAEEHAASGQVEQVRRHLGRISLTSQQALKDMRLLVYELRPAALESVGLIGALHHRLGAVEERSGIKTRLLTEELLSMPRRTEEALYYIAQEALNNALKHAQATEVTVRLRVNRGCVQLEVNDDGQSFDPHTVSPGGMGLTSMQEWVERVGGRLEVESHLGQGTTVRALVPAEDGECAGSI